MQKSIRAVLATGVKFDEAYLNPDSEIGRFANALILGTEPFRDFAASIKPKVKPGTRFEYQSVNTEVLGLLLEQVTGKPLHELGAENDAFLYRGENQPDECAFGCCHQTGCGFYRAGRCQWESGVRVSMVGSGGIGRGVHGHGDLWADDLRESGKACVIVQTSAWKLPDEQASWAESVALMDAVARAVR